jgi:hypothetical protein
MSYLIRVDDGVYDYLVSNAKSREPLGKTLRGVLINCGVHLAALPTRSLAAERRREIYREPILELLYERGGEARLANEKQALFAKVAERLSHTERTGTKSNRPVWWYDAEYERYEMVRAGLIDGATVRGIWKLTPRGASVAQATADGQ